MKSEEGFSIVLFPPQKTFKCLSDLTRGERWNRPPVRNLSNPLQMIEKHTRLLICTFPFCYSNSKFVPFSFFLFLLLPRQIFAMWRVVRDEVGCQIAVRRVFKESRGEPDAAGAATGEEGKVRKIKGKDERRRWDCRGWNTWLGSFTTSVWQSAVEEISYQRRWNGSCSQRRSAILSK